MADTYTINPDGSRAADPALVTYTHIIYALHALSVLIGVTGPATIIGSFIFGLPSIIAVILNYIYRGEARGTWVESHFDWQIRTFWFAVLWALIVGGISLILMLVLVGFITWPLGMFALGVWAIYRVARGWLRLNAMQTMPA